MISTVYVLSLQAIIASSFIPGYAGLKDLPKFRGKVCFFVWVYVLIKHVLWFVSFVCGRLCNAP